MPTHTDIELIEAAITTITRHFLDLISTKLLITGFCIIITDIGIRHDTYGNTQMLVNSEKRRKIIKTARLGTYLLTLFLKIGNLSTESSIKNHRQRINGRIRSRIQGIDLVAFTHTKTNTIHSFIKSNTLSTQVTNAKLTIWRSGTALRISCRCHGQHEKTDKLFIHILHFIS